MRIGLVTAGGDCPALIAVIRAAVRRGVRHYNHEFVGFAEGWRGVLENIRVEVNTQTVEHILGKGGTVLRSSRMDRGKIPGGFAECVLNLKRQQIDAIIAIGENGTQAASMILMQLGVHCVGVPKTIDDDLYGTNVCFGFDTVVRIPTEAIDRLHPQQRRITVCWSAK
jgi:6-phosphofructokinase